MSSQAEQLVASGHPDRNSARLWEERGGADEDKGLLRQAAETGGLADSESAESIVAKDEKGAVNA